MCVCKHEIIASESKVVACLLAGALALHALKSAYLNSKATRWRRLASIFVVMNNFGWTSELPGGFAMHTIRTCCVKLLYDGMRSRFKKCRGQF